MKYYTQNNDLRTFQPIIWAIPEQKNMNTCEKIRKNGGSRWPID